MKVTVRGGGLGLRDCPDCDSSHLGPACGMTYVERLRTTRIDSSATPSRNFTGYDDDVLTESFGYDKKERKELMMEDTKGFGPIYSDQETTPEHFQAIMGFDPNDE